MLKKLLRAHIRLENGTVFRFQERKAQDLTPV